MIPGSNLLKTALSVIAKQTVSYYVNTGRSNNDIGMFVPTYAAPISLGGSLQPVPKNKYEEYGLDFARSYFTFYASQNVIDLNRDISGDYFIFQNRRFQCESKTNWFGIDGWDGVLCVEIPNA